MGGAPDPTDQQPRGAVTQRRAATKRERTSSSENTRRQAPALIIGLGGAAPSDRGSPVVPLVLAVPLYAAQLQPDPGPAPALGREVLIQSPVPLENATVLVF